MARGALPEVPVGPGGRVHRDASGRGAGRDSGAGRGGRDGGDRGEEDGSEGCDEGGTAVSYVPHALYVSYVRTHARILAGCSAGGFWSGATWVTGPPGVGGRGLGRALDGGCGWVWAGCAVPRAPKDLKDLGARGTAHSALTGPAPSTPPRTSTHPEPNTVPPVERLVEG
ncbi:hypothetical protein GCM10018775_55720 [Streptomyces umbrinus]|nr:hypothetical protein GCM10018775_55720 [Streptomyces umbrinus]